MIIELADLIVTFYGDANRTRCFAHILNLVAKTILAQFDIHGTKGITKDFANGDEQLKNLASELEHEEAVAKETEGGVVEEEDNLYKGWIDERNDMTEEERATHNTEVRPLKLVLGKVRCSYTC